AGGGGSVGARGRKGQESAGEQCRWASERVLRRRAGDVKPSREDRRRFSDEAVRMRRDIRRSTAMLLGGVLRSEPLRGSLLVPEVPGSRGRPPLQPSRVDYSRATPTVLQTLRKRLLAIEDVLPGGAVFGGREGFWIDGTLVAELADGERIKLRLTKPLIRELRAQLDADPRVQRRK